MKVVVLSSSNQFAPQASLGCGAEAGGEEENCVGKEELSAKDGGGEHEKGGGGSGSKAGEREKEVSAKNI